MTSFVRIPLVVALCLLAAGPLRAATIYVSPTGTGDGSAPAAPASLQAALTTAATNGEEDDLKLAVGTYSAAGGTFTYDVTGDAATGDTGFYAVGGWSADFTEWSDDPALTVLDGENARRILFIDARRAGRAPDVGFQTMRFTRGLAFDGSVNGHGGAIYGEPYVAKGEHGTIELSLYGCGFDQNTAPGGGYGGAIFLTGELIAGGVDFIGNSAGSAGAVSVHVYDWYYADEPANHRHDHTLAASFEDCEFRDNVNTAAAGPVVMRVLGNSLTMESVLVHNTTGNSAGKTQTIAAYESTVRMNACRFRNNKVEWWASAIDLLGSSALVTNSLFENNWGGASGTQGSSLFTGWNYEISGHPSGPEALTVVNCTFVNNKGFVTSPTTRAYSILELQYPQTASFTNCVFVGNDQPAVYHYGSVYSLAHSRIEGSPLSQNFSDGGGNTTAEPSFQPGDTDYKLNWDSPLIDRGDNAAVPAGLDYDFKGAIRVFANRDRDVPVVDMGWDEYIDWTLNLTAPAEGTAWLNDGTPKTISWNCSNIGEDVRITLWKGPRDTAVKVLDIASVPCADQAYSWTIPDTQADGLDYAVVISPVLYPMIERGAAPIAIQRLRVTAPNGGQSLVQGGGCQITWQSAALPLTAIRIELYDGATLSRVISNGAANTGSYAWKVPYALMPGAAYRIRISTTAPYGAEDWSDASFRVLPAVTLTAPNGGQKIKRGTQYRIAWAYRYVPGPIATVRLDLYKGAALSRTIVASTPVGTAGKGSYLWRIPATQTPAATYTIRVRSTKYPTCFDFSNKPFTITR